MLTEADKRVVRAFVAERAGDSRLLETDGVRLDKIGLGGETVAKWIDGRIAIVSTESAKSDESIINLIKKEAGPGVVDFSYARKGHRVHEHGAMGRNGRGIYHQAGPSKNDIVIQPNRDKFRIDLVTSAGGNHTDVTGARGAGYDSEHEALEAAIEVQRKRGMDLAKCQYWIQQGDQLVPYESRDIKIPDRKFKVGDRVVRDDGSAPGEVVMLGDYDRYASTYRYKVQQDDGGRIHWNERSMRHEREQAPNGRRSGILSDGTRVNVYHQPGVTDEYTVVPHGMDWDAQARGGMRTMLGTTASGRGVSEWTEGQEGRHLGRSLAWTEVPPDLKRVIESRVVGEARMASNGRRKKVDNRDIFAEDDYVLAVVDRDANIGLYRIVRGKLHGPLETSASIETIARAAERDARELGIQGAVVFEQADDGSLRQVGHVIRGHWEVEMRSNGGSNERTVDLIPSTANNGWWQVRVDANVLTTDETSVEGMRIFKGSETNQVHHSGTPAHADSWYYEPSDYDGDVLWSLGLATEAQARREAERATMVPVHTGGIGRGLTMGHNGRASTVDDVAVRELSLYIENEYTLIGAPNSIGKSIDTNLRKKVANGTYDSARAPQAWQHLIDEGAKKYTKEFGSGSAIFNAATRRAVAGDFARAWEQENSIRA